MKRFITIRSVLAILALLGLVLSPVARPAMAAASIVDLGAAVQGGMTPDAAIDMAEMPCCPDGAPKPDCAKDCPLLSLCMGKTFQSEVQGTGAPVSLVRARAVPNDAKLRGFAQAPPPRPPDA